MPALLLCSCSARRADTGPWVVRRDTLGDTVVVHTVSGSVWRHPARVSEDLRIGKLEGGKDSETFGLITEMAVDSAGGILVFDSQVPALRYYDAQGHYVRTFGGGGEGPGEYGGEARGLAVLPDGQIMLRDMRNGRIDIYDPDGTPADQLRNPSGLFTGQSMTVDTAGDIYIKAPLVRLTPGKPLPHPLPVGLLHLDAHGTLVDTIRPPAPGGLGGGAPGRVGVLHPWAMDRCGDMVVGVNDPYAFDIHRRGGGVVRVEKDYTPVPMTDEEVAAYAARSRQSFDKVKPAYKGIYFGSDGTIWVQRSMPGRASYDPLGGLGPMTAPFPSWPVYEPVVFDVFERDGTYLGEVPFPPDTRPYVFSTTRVYAVQAGKYDEQYVVRFRVDTK